MDDDPAPDLAPGIALAVPGSTTMQIRPGVIDGAVAELAEQPDGTITAEIRIPGPQKG